MRGGAVSIAAFAVLLFSFTASASFIFSVCQGGDDGLKGSHSVQPEVRKWDRIIVYRTAYEDVFENFDADRQMTLVMTGKVKTGRAGFWAEYNDGDSLCCTPVQMLKGGYFRVEIPLPCTPSDTCLYLTNLDKRHSLVITSTRLTITPSPIHTPEPATLALFAMALGSVLLGRVRYRL